MKTKVHISEEVYNQLGFDPDINYAGDKVDKPDGISREIGHQAKILSHNLQHKLHMNKENEANTKIQNNPYIFLSKGNSLTRIFSFSIRSPLVCY